MRDPVGENEARVSDDTYEKPDLDRYNEAVSKNIDPAEIHRTIIQAQIMKMREERYNELVTSGMTSEMAAGAILGFAAGGFDSDPSREYASNTITVSGRRRVASAVAGFMTVQDTTHEGASEQHYGSTTEETRTFIHTAETATALFEPSEELSEILRLDPGVRVISRNEVSRIVESLRPAGTARDTLLSHVDLLPTGGIELDGRKFMFSDIFQGYRGYDNAILYESDNAKDEVRPRLYYKSRSDGGWRATPGIRGRDGRLHKGYELRGAPEFGHYVQTTRPDENIVAYLEHSRKHQGNRKAILREESSAHHDLLYAFDTRQATNDRYLTFPDEVQYKYVLAEGLGGYLSAHGFVPDRAQGFNSLMNIQLPDNFEPDFLREPQQVYANEHTLLGEVALEVYPALLDGREIEWHIARDLRGRMWVDRIQFADGRLTSLMVPEKKLS